MVTFNIITEKKVNWTIPLTFTVVLINLIMPHYYRQYVDNIFVLFTSPEHLEAFRTFLNGWHATMSFIIEREKQNWIFFFDVQIR